MKKTISIIAGALISLVSFAQQIQVQVILPPFSSRVTDLFDRSGDIRIIATNTSNEAITFRLDARMLFEEEIIGRIRFQDSPSETLNPAETKTYVLRDLIVLKDALNYDRAFATTVLRTGYVPSGNVTWCFSLLQANNPNIVVTPEICRSQVVTAFQPPIAIAPQDREMININTLPIFRWTPVTPAFLGVLNYEVEVFEVLPGQDPMNAFRSNQPILSRRSPALQLVWPLDVVRETGTFVWTVRAFDNDNNAVGGYETFTEIRSFTFSSDVANSGNNFSETAIDGAILMSFYPKGSKVAKYEMFVPGKNKEAAQRLFEESDQASKYNLKISEVKNLPANITNLGTPILTGSGDIVKVVTEDGGVLTFQRKPENSTVIGRQSVIFIDWKDDGGIFNADGKGTKRTTSQAQTKPDLL
jgi:hypothetical protein